MTKKNASKVNEIGTVKNDAKAKAMDEINLLTASLLKDDQKHRSLIKEYNNGYKKLSSVELNAIEDKIRKAESDYELVKRRQESKFCAMAENPAIEAAKRYTFTIIGHSVKSVEGVKCGFKTTSKSVYIDIVDVMEEAGKPINFRHNIEKFGQLCTIKVMEDVGASEEEKKLCYDTFYMQSVARAIENGKTPTSNTQMVKFLQKIVNDVIGKELPEYKVNKYDVNDMMTLVIVENRKTQNRKFISHANTRLKFLKVLNDHSSKGRKTNDCLL